MKKLSKAGHLLWLLFASTGSLNAQNSTFSWAVALAGSDIDFIRSIAVDDSGYVYSTGYFSGTADFDPSTSTANFTSNGSRDFFISKLDMSGGYIWARTFGGIGVDDGYSVALDDSGSVYVAGTFAGTVDFDPGPGVFNLVATSGHDAFLLKLNAAGNFSWVAQFGGSSSGDERAYGVKTDSIGNVYLTGFFGFTTDLDPGPGTSNFTASGSRDIFICKLSSAGNLKWAKQIGGLSTDWPFALTLDDMGYLYTTGVFSSTADFDPGPATSNLTSAGLHDNFVCKMDTAGNFIWAKSFGGTSEERSHSIAVDKDGSVFTTGYFRGTADFDPGAATTNFTASGMAGDIFISKLDANGDYLWAKQFGGPFEDAGYGLDVDQAGNVYTTGTFNDTVDFGAGSSVYNLISNSYDVFINKLDSAGNFVWAKSMGGSDWDQGYSLFVDDSLNVYTGGYFGRAVDLDPGPRNFHLPAQFHLGIYRDAFIQKLEPCPNSTSTTLNISTCDGYISPSGRFTWTTSGTYSDALTAINGCDSIIIVNLSILSNGSMVNVSSCDSYTSPSGHIWDSSGTYMDTLINSANCDSVITFNLTVHSIDTSISRVGNNIQSNATGASYQWLDCSNGYSVLVGDTSFMLSITSNGSYAVQITQNGCTDTSRCIVVNDISIQEGRLPNLLTYYPNPSRDKVTLAFGELQKLVNIKVSDSNGRLILDRAYKESKRIEIELPKRNGYYFIQIDSPADKPTVIRVLRE